MQKIHLIITGGTIDSHWDPIRDTAVPNERSIIPEFFLRLNLPFQFDFTTSCMKDSRAITDEDRSRIVQTIEASSSKSFLVTHGTYTMAETARYLKNNLKREDVAIVLTGSFVPLTDVIRSDGGFNMGFAISQLLHIDPGVYVAMNAQIFEADQAEKVIHEGKFAPKIS
jgi:L-asparaginase